MSEPVERPWWWQDAPPEDGLVPVPERVDVAIVGSGYCGLACAIELARAGLSVVVLDAGLLGGGASARNGGMVSGGLGLPVRLERDVGPELAARLRAEGRESFAFLEHLIRAEGIEADWDRSGRFLCAWSPGHYRRLLQRAETLTRTTGVETRAVPRVEQRSEIGSDFFHGGIVITESGAVHPAKLHAGLRRASRGAGAVLCGRAAVETLRREGGRWRVRTARGTVDAKTVFVATNGYTGKLTPWLRRRLIPIASYMLATEALEPELARSLSPRGRMFVDTKRVLSYFRLSPDGRHMLFGGRVSFLDADVRRGAARLRHAMVRVFPELARVRLTHAWKGNIAMTFDHLPHLGEHEGIHFAGGCQGSGVAMATWLGHQTARKLIGRRNAPSAFELPPFPTRPFYDGRPWFLPAVGTWYRLQDALDRRFAG